MPSHGGFAPERTGGLSLLLAAADVSQQSPETAPGNIDTTWFSRRDVAALYPVSPDTEQHDAGPAGGKAERYG